MADSKIEVGKAYVTIIPSMQGSQATITEEMTGAANAAATQAGKSAGGNLMQSVGKGMQSAGKNMSTYLTAPLAGVGVAALGAFKSVDVAMDTIVKKTGASGEELDSMSEMLNNLATSIPTDFETAGAAIGEVNTRFGLTGQALEDLSGQFIKFADLNGQDVSNSVDSVSKMMAGFGLEAEDAGRILDALNVVGQQTGVDVGSLADTVASNAKQFQEMGLSAEEAASFLGSASMAGLDSSAAMMGLKTAMKEATSNGQTLGEALQGFDEVMSSNASESDKLAAAYELFGTRAGGAIENAVANGKLNLTDFTSSLGDFEGSVSSTFEETLDPIDKFKTTINDLVVTGSELGESLLTILEPAIQKVADIIGKVSDWFTSLSPQTQDMIVKIGLAVAAIGPIIGILGSVISAVSTLSTVMTVLTGPIGLVVAAIAALIAIGIAVYKHWDEIKAFLIETWESIKETASSVWEAIKSFIEDPIGKIVNAVETAVTTILDKMGFSGLADKVKSIFETIKSFITDPIETAKNVISNVIDTIKNLFNFQISWPHIPMPHFGISPAGWKFGDLLKGTIPSLSIEWYAKAATEGALFTRPTIIGVGDATQPELLIGQDTLREMLGGGDITINVYGAPGQDVSRLADIVAAKIQRQVNTRKAGLR